MVDGVMNTKIRSLFRRVSLSSNWKRNFISSNSHEFTIEEVHVPLPYGHYLAGKLWKSVHQDPKDTKNSIPILALHGWIDNAGSFDPLIPLIMKENMTVFAFDFPGHGLSSHTCPVYYDTYSEALFAVHRILRFFQWDKVTLLGHSLGAIISFVYAAGFPLHIHSYIALDNHRPIVRDYIHSLRIITRLLFEVERKLKRDAEAPSYTYDEILNRLYISRRKSITLEGCATLLTRGSVRLGYDQYSFSHDIRTVVPTSMGRFTKLQTEEIARQIKCPCCIIKGKPGYNYEPIEDFIHLIEIMQEQNDHVELHWVPGTHHFHLNEPHLVAPIISKFLNS